ncbi:IMP-specific 5'-nucleotidase 1 [Suhomyces tanzawaensis NRRL Y-17324]|uniref:IMP-specific 5'-nucleotidase 1 n=1 Tax=Suhomyces tanzawaensis NRRL Y-17324 TaxID=984487 RepID=A0A1E4SDI7_9ASCO|nr:IMP-specific 5'-nucleotidase 1 [Suhomyces tanzawaensis NRRL Y-17324]ODV77577.1 IMP-specific 5'-nucleotidase 1 [Suhomyces tanzawaensis NRRL Y-17324]
MTSRYRVEYALKSHRRDEFIEWIKSLLAVPFVLHADVQNYSHGMSHHYSSIEEYEQYLVEQDSEIALECQKRYQEIFEDVERLIEHTILIDDSNQKTNRPLAQSRLRRLVPSVGKFFTTLPLTEAFLIEDERRGISKRRLVSPSFNDVRMILNTAQILALTKIYRRHSQVGSKLKLITFDGDVTLYDDGKSLQEDDPIVQRLVALLSLDLFIGVVTAAGYPGELGAEKYYERLKGLIDAIKNSSVLTAKQKENMLVMGGESNYLFRYDSNLERLKFVDAGDWYLPIMKSWNKEKVSYIMQTIHKHFLHLQNKFGLVEHTTIILKERSAGIIPNPGYKILREHLEEMVLSCSLKLSEILSHTSDDTVTNEFMDNEDPESALKDGIPTEDIKVCAFNGGADVWVDIGDKSLGVESLQKYLCQDESYDHICPIQKSESLHIGDQFASLGANDFKARLSACTVWIANPTETVETLDDLINHLQ